MNGMNRDARSLSDMLADRRVSHVDAIPSGGIAIHFIDGTRLTISPEPAGFTVTFHEAVRGPRRPATHRRGSANISSSLCGTWRGAGSRRRKATFRSISKVSAPSVHAMIKTLERRGFIARGHDFNGQALPRSIRVLIDLT